MKFIYFSLFFFFLIDAHANRFDHIEKLMHKTDCLACHQENQKLVGPSFKEIADRYESNSHNIHLLIQSVKNGSSGSWGDMAMPPHPTLDSVEVKKIIEGILSLRGEDSSRSLPWEVSPPEDGTQGGNDKEVSENDKVDGNDIAKAEEFVADAEDVHKGAEFFQGKIRFAHGGPSCIACHHVKNDAIIGGGVLAKELTTVFSRLGGEGVRVILGQPPFPVMQRAYKDKPLEEGEIQALVTFLQSADQKKMVRRPKDYGLGLFLSGVFGATLFFIFIALFGYRRKKVSVNQEIYDRQIKSE